eukprot:TRINITY_DN7543_c0_g1_i2.p1 TRINITY_DN7543_c0_g1~~TRINITY_DN7543_c0_g1_i2.p1  ORF type:complete len:224 (+),score=26.28 TRINITY_DN7543_c0_g1_i2:34-705(+)
MDNTQNSNSPNLPTIIVQTNPTICNGFNLLEYQLDHRRLKDQEISLRAEVSKLKCEIYDLKQYIRSEIRKALGPFSVRISRDRLLVRSVALAFLDHLNEFAGTESQPSIYSIFQSTLDQDKLRTLLKKLKLLYDDDDFDVEDNEVDSLLSLLKDIDRYEDNPTISGEGDHGSELTPDDLKKILENFLKRKSARDLSFTVIDALAQLSHCSEYPLKSTRHMKHN